MKTWITSLKYHLNPTERKIVVLSSLGGMLEFYDFIIYGVFSTYFAKQFFPSNNELISIIASFTVFIVGYIARPIGGILFSHIGDEIGRKIVLILTMIIMGVSSLGIGLLPTYAQIGIAAPILLLLLRLIQGLAIGGELPSMIVYVTESLPQKRGFAIGSVLFGTDAGLILGMLINLLVITMFNKAQLDSYGWRIPFILGGFLCFISYKIRKSLHETSAFEKNHDRPAFPLLHLLTKYPLQVLQGTAITAIMGCTVMLSIIFMPTYLNNVLKLNSPGINNSLLISTIVTVVAVYVMGLIANRYNPKKLMHYCLIGAIPTVLLSYNLITRNTSYGDLLLGLCMLTILQGFFATLSPILLSYIFPTEIRLSGVALSYNLGHTIFGGLAPILVTSIINKTHMVYLTPVIYFISVIIITLIAMYYFNFGRKSNRTAN